MFRLNNFNKNSLKSSLWLSASKSYRVIFFSVCTLLISLPVCLNAEEDITVSASDQDAIKRIKMAYIYNFLKYIEIRQPNSTSVNLEHDSKPTNPPLTNQSSIQLQTESIQAESYWVCVLGEDPYQSLLTEMQKKKVKNLAVIVKRFESVAEVNDCHIVYISHSKAAQIKTIMTALSGKKILSVSDIPSFTQQGGMIRFTSDKSKVGIEINLSNVRQSNIQISALLLEIAQLVE